MTKRAAAAAVLIVFILALFPARSSRAADAENAGAGRGRAKIPAEQLFIHSADAVFLIETFDENGESIRTGSGFFMSGGGMAVTNLHVFEGAETANITLYSGEVYPVEGVNARSAEFNLCIFSVKSESIEFKYLTAADSGFIEAGNTVYTIGSPLGYINTMTAGIISKESREVEGETLIQFTAPISFGSGGSPLINTYGEVVGVTSSSFSYGQNLNLAVPVNRLESMQIGDCISLRDLRELQAATDASAPETP